MIRAMTKGPASVLAILALLAGCSSAPEGEGQFSLLKTVPSMVDLGKQENATPGAITQEQMSQTLAATDLPILLFSVEKSGAQLLMVQIEQNGPYRTFATSDRRTIIVRDGIMTGTRGWGGDLMSSDVSNLRSVLLTGQGGTAEFTQRYLHSDDSQFSRSYACKIAPGDTLPVAAGALNETGRMMTARCQSGESRKDLAFVVSRKGDVVATRQWMNDLNGYVGLQILRR